MGELDRLAVATLGLAAEAVAQEAAAARTAEVAPWLARNAEHRERFQRTGQWVPTAVAA